MSVLPMSPLSTSLVRRPGPTFLNCSILKTLDPKLFATTFFAIEFVHHFPVGAADLFLGVLVLLYASLVLWRSHSRKELPLSIALKRCPDSDEQVNSSPRSVMSSMSPVASPVRRKMVFTNKAFKNEVSELLTQLQIGPDCAEKLLSLRDKVEALLRVRYIDVKVRVIASSNPDASCGFATAVPEVAVVASITSYAPSSPLGGSIGDRERSFAKSRMRGCLECLIGKGFQFRRRSYKDADPRVVLSTATEGFAIDFLVNSNEMLQRHDLVDHCTRQHPLAKDLILFVRFWARERGLSDSSRVSLPPFAWVVLTLFFLQVARPGKMQHSRLGSVQSYLQSSEALWSLTGSVAPTTVSAGEEHEAEIAALIREFFQFYAQDFDWSIELVSLRRGSRQKSAHSNNRPFVENPFDPDKDLLGAVSNSGVERAQHELLRVHRLLQEAASLNTILEPWRPQGNICL